VNTLSLVNTTIIYTIHTLSLVKSVIGYRQLSPFVCAPRWVLSRIRGNQTLVRYKDMTIVTAYFHEFTEIRIIIYVPPR